MHVQLIDAEGVHEVAPTRLPEVYADVVANDRGLVWVDVPAWDDAATALLGQLFDLHPAAMRSCAVRNHVPSLHVYPDHVFIVLHAPQRGPNGHVHFVELDRFIGPRFLVTVHGPVNERVPAEVARRDVEAVLERIRSGRFRPTTSFGLSHAVVSAMTRRIESYLDEVTAQVWELEQQVTLGDRQRDEPEGFLEQLFRVRHALTAVNTISAQSAEIYRRLVTLSGVVPEGDRRLVNDLVDQFDRLHRLAEHELEYLDGVIAFFRARTETRMMIAGERLAVIAVVTLPVTALASVLGMNLVEGARWNAIPLSLTVLVMITMSTWLLRWARRKGWW